MNQIIEELRNLFSQNSIPVFGMAKAKSLGNEPPGYKPSDMIDSAESILCLGIPIPKGIFRCKERSEWMYWRAANVYYRKIDVVLMQACAIIEEKDEIAVPVYSCFPYDIRGKGDFWGYMGLVKMAEAVKNRKGREKWIALQFQIRAEIIAGRDCYNRIITCHGVARER